MKEVILVPGGWRLYMVMAPNNYKLVGWVQFKEVDPPFKKSVKVWFPWGRDDVRLQ